MARLAGKVALLTGAGTGIGRATAVLLAEEGADVIVTSRNPEHVEETREEAERAAGRPVAAHVLDVSDRAAVDEVVARVARDKGRIDVLSNNAGLDLAHGPSVGETTDEEWDELLRVNLTSVFWVCRAALRAMGEGASIVNIASINSFVCWGGDAVYTATKGGLLQFTRALAVDVAKRGIRANCVCPGVIDTPLTDSFLERADDPNAQRAFYAAAAPLGRLGTAREVASCVLFLASDESSFVTGSALMVDGGTTAIA